MRHVKSGLENNYYFGSKLYYTTLKLTFSGPENVSCLRRNFRVIFQEVTN